MKIVSSEGMRRIEQASVQAGVSLDTLMENAGLAVAESVRDVLRSPSGRSALVLVGPGNNGGDGFVVARHLAWWGARVSAYICTSRPDEDPKRVLAAEAGVQIASAQGDGDLAHLSAVAREADVIVDGVLGTGRVRPIERPLSGILGAVREATASSPPPVIAIDVPTGADADTGRFDPAGLPADITLMLGRPKLGPYLRPGEGAWGALRILDIGIPAGLDDDVAVELLTPDSAGALLPDRPSASHKGTFGRALIVAGSPRYVGAAYLAAAAATRSGAGLVTLAASPAVHPLVAARLAEATYLPLAGGPDDGLDAPAATSEIRAALPDFASLLVGPGLGQEPSTIDLVAKLLLGRAERPPTVLDADALNILSDTAGWWDRVSGQAVLTPHPGEMARLLGIPGPGPVQEDRLTAAQDAARRSGHIVVLKGACTVIAHPDGRAHVSPWVNPGLAKGGTGDVLAGLIAGLLAQMPAAPFAAAALGVYVHGLAADVVRTRLGETGMTAGDLLPALPQAFLELGSGLKAGRRPQL